MPIERHLIGKKNQYNFKFSKIDIEKIVNWLKENTEISILAYEGIFNLIEGKLIGENTPLLNIAKNPLKLLELVNDRERCRDIARGIKPCDLK